MDWDAIAAISEIIGTTAVVISLIYVGIQIRHSTAVARSTARQSVTELMLESTSNLVEDCSLAAAFVKEMKGEELDDVEHLRLLGRAYLAMRNWENIHYQYRIGMLTSDEWQGFRANLEAILEWPSTRNYWQNEKQFYSAAFRTEVNKILQNLADRPDWQSHSYVLKTSE
jgi:hypothetical protein